MSKRNDAKRMMAHYLRMTAKAAGVHWDSDNEVEVEDIVDLITDAAKQELKEEQTEEKAHRKHDTQD